MRLTLCVCEGENTWSLRCVCVCVFEETGVCMCVFSVVKKGCVLCCVCSLPQCRQCSTALSWSLVIWSL